MKILSKISLVTLALVIVAQPTFAGWRDTKTSSDTFEASDYNRIIDASWNELGGDIWRATGSVGIGTTSPSSELDIVGNLEVGGTDFFVDDSAGRVGIGTTAPGYNLEVEGNGDFGSTLSFFNGARGLITWSDTGFARFQIRAGTGNALSLGANGTHDQLVINSSGNVGIGTTAPAQKLHVYGTAPQVLVDGSATTQDPSLYLTQQGATIEGLKIWYDASIGDAYFDTIYNNDAASLHFRTKGSTERLTILGSGNVGIGTTSPGAKLHLVGSAVSNFDKDNYATTIIEDADGRLEFVASDSGSNAAALILNTVYGAGDNRKWFFGAGTSADSNKLHIGYSTNLSDVSPVGSSMFVMTTGGNVGIGTTAPTTKLEVAGTIYSTTGGIKLPDGTVLDAADDLGAGKWSGSTDIYYTGGAVGIGTTAPTYTLSLGGDSNRTFWLERNTTTAGSALTIQSGGALSGGSNLNGGALALSSGISTGTGSSAINFYTATAGSSGSSDNSPTLKMTILGSGNVGIGTTAPTAKLEVSGIIKSTPASSATCDADAEGGIYYDSDDNNFYGCNGSEWIALSGVGTATLSSPADGAIDQASAPTLSWLAATGALSYKVYLDNNSDFSSPIVNGVTTNATSYAVSTLDAGTQYFWKVQACSAADGGGTCGSEGSSWDFTTLSGFSCGDELLDGRDSQTYATVLIGDQCWMAENLNVGSIIASSATMPTDNGVIEKWCNGSDAYGHTVTGDCTVYGGLYSWGETMAYSTTAGAQGICPDGWHVPTDAEQSTLEVSLATDSCTSTTTGWKCDPAGTKMSSLTLNGDNSSGFSALLAGYRASNGAFYYRTTADNFWSSTLYTDASRVWNRQLNKNNSTVWRGVIAQDNGYAVRCIRDAE